MKKRVKGIHDISTSPHPRKETERSKILNSRDASLSLKGRHEEMIFRPRVWAFYTKPTLSGYEKRIKKRHFRVERVAEPQMDVFEEIENLVVLAQLPKMKKEDIHFEIDGDILSIRALDRFGPRRYEKEILLPFMVEQTHVQTSYRDGIFEIGFRRKREPQHE